MQPTQHRLPDNLPAEIVGERRVTGDALVDALVQSGAVEVGDVFGHNTS